MESAHLPERLSHRDHRAAELWLSGARCRPREPAEPGLRHQVAAQFYRQCRLRKVGARPLGKLELEAAKLIRSQAASIAELETEMLEQCRINGAGGERELLYISRIAALEADRAEWVEPDRMQLGKDV